MSRQNCRPESAWCSLFYGLTSYSPLGLGDAHERSIKAIYKAAGWDLADERFLQLHGLIAAMPMTLADGLAHDLKRLKRLKTMLSTSAAHIAPMQGEFLGGTDCLICLLVGRRGQPFYWSPFENDAGNHNVAICGKSGSGKVGAAPGNVRKPEGRGRESCCN